MRPQEWGRGTQECVRHTFVNDFSTRGANTKCNLMFRLCATQNWYSIK